MRFQTLFGLLIVVAACSSSTEDISEKGNTLSIRCGWGDTKFSGQLVYLDVGGMAQGIADATFTLPDDAALFGREFLVTLNGDGEFSSTLGIRVSTRTMEEPGTPTTTSTWVQEHTVLIEAPGCLSRTIQYTEDWNSQVIVLECPERHDTMSGSG